MHVTIIALGSSGDVIPFISLGRGLVDAGHQVRMSTMRNFEQAVLTAGMHFHPVSGDAAALLASGPGSGLGEAGGNIPKMWAAAMRSFGSLARTFAEDLGQLLNAGPTDLIVNQLPGGLYGFDLAEKMDIPMVMAGVIPLTATRHFPMVAFPPSPVLIPGYNALTYRLAEQLVWQFYRPTINRWRTEALGLPPQSFWGPFRQMRHREMVVLNGFSHHVVPAPPDWGQHVHQTGYWYAQHEGWQPPQSLSSFLDHGDPPIFIGFGSMPIRSPDTTIEKILTASEMAGVRLVLHRGWAGLEPEQLPKHVHSVGFSDYAWLFPRMMAVVHHGGAGTTAYAMRAGVPNLIVPFVFDQFFWGRRTAELGLGPRPIPFKKLSVENLTRALIQLRSQSEFKQAAGKLGQRLRNENGLQDAVRILETIASHQAST